MGCMWVLLPLLLACFPVALEAASDAELLVLGIFEDFILSMHMKSSSCLISLANSLIDAPKLQRARVNPARKSSAAFLADAGAN